MMIDDMAVCMRQVPTSPSLSAPTFPSPPCSPSDDEQLLRFSAHGRQQDRGRDTYFKEGIGVSLLLRHAPGEGEPRRTQLTARVFRDVDSLAAARSEARQLAKRKLELEADLRLVARDNLDHTARNSVAQRTLENNVEKLHEELKEKETELRWRDKERKNWERKAEEACAAQREAEREALLYRRKMETESLKVTSSERAAEALKSKYTHQKKDLRSGADERSSLSAQVQHQRHEIRGACTGPFHCAARPH